MSRIMRSPTSPSATVCALASASNVGATTASVGRCSATPRCAASAMIALAGAEIADRAATCRRRRPCAARNVLAIPPPITNALTRCEQVREDADLVVDLRAADRADERLRADRRSARRARRSSASIRNPAYGGQIVRDAFGRGVGAMCGTERVVDVEVAERGKLRARRPDRSASSSGWKRTFSSSTNVAVAQRVDRGARGRADAIVRERDRRRRAARLGASATGRSE